MCEALHVLNGSALQVEGNGSDHQQIIKERCEKAAEQAVRKALQISFDKTGVPSRASLCCTYRGAATTCGCQVTLRSRIVFYWEMIFGNSKISSEMAVFWNDVLYHGRPVLPRGWLNVLLALNLQLSLIHI